MNPSLDAGCPCLLSIRNPWGGHHIVVDGYGYNSSTLYHHLNLGWGPDDFQDGWYNLPSVHGLTARYMTSPACTYNISPADICEIISGRTLDSTGAVVAGVTVTA